MADATINWCIFECFKCLVLSITMSDRTPLKHVPKKDIEKKLATDVALQILARRFKRTDETAEVRRLQTLYPSLESIIRPHNWYLLCDEHRAVPDTYRLVTGEVSHHRVCGICTLRLSFDKNKYACDECGGVVYICPHGQAPRKHLCLSCHQKGVKNKINESYCKWCNIEKINCFIVKSLDYLSTRMKVPEYECSKDVINTVFTSDQHIRDAREEIVVFEDKCPTLLKYIRWIVSVAVAKAGESRWIGNPSTLHTPQF
jgi:hypothetical protein